MSRYATPSVRRPVLVLVEQSAVEGTRMEVAVILDEARAHVRRMRMAMQTSFWTDPEFAVLAKPILDVVESYARKVEDDEGQAA